MNNGNFNPVVVDGVSYCIKHLQGLSFGVDVLFGNGDIRTIMIHTRPTNHLYTREVTDSDWPYRSSYEQSGAWLKSFQHHQGNYQSTVGSSPKIKEHRIFCLSKWNDSKLFPEFVNLIGATPTQITVLANFSSGDDKTCLSGILEIDGRPNELYLVFFTLHKVNSKECNMLIESAYCVPDIHKKAKLLLDKHDSAKPFIVILKNVMEGRKPFESAVVNKRSNKRKKNKSKKP